MPLVKSVKSLSETCVNFILLDGNDFCKKIGLDSVNSGKRACSPFDYLPTVVLEELAKAFREKEINKHPTKINQKGFFELLLTPYLRTLDLRHWRGNSNVLQLAALKSPNLETMMLGHYCNRKYPQEFLNCIPKFSKLQSLDVSICGVGDNCLQLLGTYCKELRELYARGSDVSDEGIRGLCVIGNCKSIRALVLDGSKVTVKGIQLALDNLPELKVLYHASILECLAEIAQTALNEKRDMPKYSLSALYILENTIYQSHSLNLSVLLCPKVKRISVTWKNGKLTDNDLLSLTSLKNLCTLEIQHNAFLPRQLGELIVTNTNLTFHGGVAPLLQTLGNSLKKISLKGYFVDVDIPVIIESCPNLHSLTLTVKRFRSKRSSIEGDRKQQAVIKQLKTLDLDGSIATENLIVLLSSPSLEHVRLSNCLTLTDQVLHQAAHQHSFRNLRIFKLFHCPSLTKIGINILFHNTSLLNEIHLTWCENVKKEWKDILTDKTNWDLIAIHHS